MARLTRADMEAALAFAGEVSTAAPQHERADARLLELIAGLVRSDLAAYTQLDESCREIAERLWISPATVTKHLENVYGKLAVGSRTAALARSGRSLAASDPSERIPIHDQAPN